MKFRVKQYSYGFVAEVQTRTWYGRVKWVSYVNFSGMSDVAFLFTTYDSAERAMLREIKHDIIRNSREHVDFDAVVEDEL